MSPPPLVSVITIFLNAERFMEEAIASVFAQTWPHWELLLVDDGSSDRSTAIAQGYAARHPERVHYLEHPGHVNRGMSASRNLGLAQARGDYIAFLDADDVFLPERLAKHVAMLEARPEVGAVQGEILCWYSWQGTGTEAASDCRAPGLPFDPGSVLEPPTLLLMLLDSAGATSPGICNVTVRRSLVGAVGGFENSFRGHYEDQVFISKVYLSTRVGLVSDCLAWYRQHPQSCTQACRRGSVFHRGCFHPQRTSYLRWLEGYFIERAVEDPRLVAALAHQTWPLRHPWLGRLIMLPTVLAEDAVRAMRVALSFALPAPLYSRLLRWRGAGKYQRWQAHIERISERASRDAAGG